MTVPGLVSPIVALLTWPVSRFRDVGRTYELALLPSDGRAVVRGAIGTDPLHLPAMEGIAMSGRSDVVGRVGDDGRLEIYVASRRSSGLGLVGSVEASGPGSRIVTRVGWTSLHRWGNPVFTVLAIVSVGTLVHRAAGEPDGIASGAAIALAVMVGGGWIMHLVSSAGRARRQDLPAIFERLERALRPHLRQPPSQEQG